MSAVGTTSTARGTAALDLLGRLYPEPLTVRVGSGDGAGHARSWHALPSAEQPRLLLPEGRPVAVTRALRRQLTGHRWRTRAARTGLSLVARTGLMARLPGREISVTGPEESPSIEDPLRELLGVDDVWLTMPVGPARANRKPVLQVTDDAGRVLAFVKVGHTPLTAALVRREAEALGQLATRPPAGVRPPELLALTPWRDCEVLVLEPLWIPARRLAGAAARRRLLEVVRAIAVLDRGAPVLWRDHPWRARLLAEAGRCGDLAEPLRHQVDRIPDGVPLAVGHWHGDLNPGNVALVAGPCPVWDWERFERGVPVGFDLLHHDLHAGITEDGSAPREAAARLLREAGATLAPLGVGSRAADATARAYLVTLACRYLGDDQRAAGGRLGAVEEWLLPALREVAP